MKPQQNIFTLAGASLALLAVISGAFGAHALKDQLTGFGTVAIWETAVDYQMWHALALLIVAQLALPPRARRTCMLFLCAGTLLFSGSLYYLALDGPRWLGPITPLGGLFLIIGWLTLIISLCRKQSSH
jgi:uncharacterized membrane protein YgdD (TMEM256/DUF423 family)